MGFKDWTKKIFPSEYDIDGADYVEEDADMLEEDRDLSYGREKKEAYAPAGNTAGNVRLASAQSSAIEMKVVSPTKFDAVTQIADLLLERKTVLLNLENTNKETAKRLIDFLSGVAYALGGDVQKVADNTFAVTPNNVAVSNEAVDPANAAAEGDLYE